MLNMHPFLTLSFMNAYYFTKSFLAFCLVCFTLVNFDIVKVLNIFSAFLPHPSPVDDNQSPHLDIDLNDFYFMLIILFLFISYLCKLLVFSLGLFSFMPYHSNLNTIRKFKSNVIDSAIKVSMEFMLIILIAHFLWYHPLFLLNYTITINQHVLNILILLTKITLTGLSHTRHISNLSIKICLNFILSYHDFNPVKLMAIWYYSLLITLSLDIHPNPGPNESSKRSYKDGFFSFCNWNLNTLSKNDFYRITLLEAHNQIFNYDIISLCETSLNDSFNADDIILPGYKFFPLNNPNGSQNGGVGIFFRENLPLRIRTDLCFDECLVTELQFEKKKIFFTVLYRNPAFKANSPQFTKFLNDFKELNVNISNENPFATFFTGDFNAHSQTWYPEGDSNLEGTLLVELFDMLNLKQTISEPTHFFRDDCRPSCIDLIITDQPNLILDSGVRSSLDPSVKHQIIYCKLNFQPQPLPNYKRHVWYYNRANTVLLNRAISNFDWANELNRFVNPTDQVQFFNSTLLNIMSNFIPNQSKIFRPRDPPWFSDYIRKLLRKQNKLYRKFTRQGYTDEDKINLENHRIITSNSIILAKETYLKNQGVKLSSPETAKKTYWNILKNFLNKCKVPRIPPLFHNNEFISNCKQKAEIFNKYFSSQCTPFQNDSILPPFKKLTHNNIESLSIIEDEIKLLLNNIDSAKATGPDGISAKMLKMCGDTLIVPIKIIFLNILKTGNFPLQWKKANVTPVHKKKDKQLVENYRPISLLPILSKIFERIIFKNLYNHLVSNKLISKNQSGFRPGDSCTNQLLFLINEIHKAFDDENCLEVRSVYLDMSKAFDKVWHQGLIFKLKQNGVSGQLLKLLSNYLSNRSQRVVINGQNSNWAPILSGVPQGSVLGPLLFLIFVNDLETGIISNVKFFADDVSLFSIVHNPLTSAIDLNRDLNVISSWAHQWKMSFNPDPTKPAVEIIFSSKISETIHPPLFFQNSQVKRVDHHKHLGLILDSKLSFARHINEKINKAKKWIGMIRHLRSYLPTKTLDQIYKMYARPHLDYCDIIYHSPIMSHDFSSSLTLNYRMNILESTQYQAALAITGAWKGTNLDKIYEQLGWESLNERRVFRRLTMFFKIMNNLTPTYLKEPLPFQQGRYRLRTNCIINAIPCRNTKHRNSFFPNSISLWNNLDTVIKRSRNISSFKSSILKIIRPQKKKTFDIHDTNRLKWIFQLRVGLSPLRSHKKRHNFNDTPDDICLCSTNPESTEHFLLKCPLFSIARVNFLNTVRTTLLSYNMIIPNDSEFTKLLLYGNPLLSDSDNKTIILATLNFISNTDRFA